MAEQGAPAPPERAALRRLHLQVGWGALLLFATIGLLLEGLHGFKVGFYLDVGQETRRLLWTLGHAHGALLAGLNVAFGLSAPHLAGSLALASRSLMAATLLLPGGFLLGGVDPKGGDPGLGILLVPPGALLLLVSLGLIAAASLRAGPRD